MYTDENKYLIDSLLHDPTFREAVESDIGFVKKVDVVWEDNEIRFYGSLGAKKLFIDETLATMKGQIS